eukprot:CAMPEP_0174231284 /NCGR_PEP_ID=MMETSP0417-20130205/1851_1 /TAXON_ID=242541 /ORGANISM="Mayorella sp, Strain BSH-02190019" /LENGTH=1131 /DNA_ID=CAMNT_0015309139 /DNA_START=70 /DNA_END=3465 /DNA_ORIENTATION=+
MASASETSVSSSFPSRAESTSISSSSSSSSPPPLFPGGLKAAMSTSHSSAAPSASSSNSSRRAREGDSAAERQEGRRQRGAAAAEERLVEEDDGMVLPAELSVGHAPEVATLLVSVARHDSQHRRLLHLLTRLQSVPGFYLLLLHLVECQQSCSLLAAIHFRTVVSASWRNRECPGELERQRVRVRLLELVMCQKLKIAEFLGIALSIIIRHDFPRKWPDGLALLVSRVNAAQELGQQHRGLMCLHLSVNALVSKTLAKAYVQRLGPELMDLVTKYWRSSFSHCLNHPKDRAVSHKMSKLCLQMCRNILLYALPMDEKDGPAVSSRESVRLFFSFGELISGAMPSKPTAHQNAQERELTRICRSQLSVFGDTMRQTMQKFRREFAPFLPFVKATIATQLSAAAQAIEVANQPTSDNQEDGDDEYTIPDNLDDFEDLSEKLEERYKKQRKRFAFTVDCLGYLSVCLNEKLLGVEEALQLFAVGQSADHCLQVFFARFLAMTALDHRTLTRHPEYYHLRQNSGHQAGTVGGAAEQFFVSLANAAPKPICAHARNLYSNLWKERGRSSVQQQKGGSSAASGGGAGTGAGGLSALAVNPSDWVLQMDAILRALGLAREELHMEVRFGHWFSTMLVEMLQPVYPGYVILQRRIAWLCGRWRHQLGLAISEPHRSAVYGALLSMMGDTCFLVVRLAAARGLGKQVKLANYSKKELVPHIPTLLSVLFRLIHATVHSDTHVELLLMLQAVFQKHGRQLADHVGALIECVNAMWSANENHQATRHTVLRLLSLVVTSMGSPVVARYCEHLLPVTRVSVDVSSSDSLYLLHDGLDLWLQLLQYTPPKSLPVLMSMFPQLLVVIDHTWDEAIASMDLLQTYIMLGVNASSTSPLASALPAIVSVLNNGMEVLAFDQGRVQVVRTVNVLLQVLPLEAYELLVPFLGYALERILSDEEVTSIVLELHKLFSRFSFTHPTLFIQLLQAKGAAEELLAGLFDTLVEQLDRCRDIYQRKMTALALCAMLARYPVLLPRLASLIGVVTSVAIDVSYVGGLGLSDEDFFEEEGDEHSCYFAQQRRLSTQDFVYRLNLGAFFLECLAETAATLGQSVNEMLQQRVEPALLKQLAALDTSATAATAASSS